MKEREFINGWIVIDKPYDIGSTNVVSKLKWSLSPNRVGHAGTLDPLATGVLPIAFGQATKLIPYVMDGSKVYEFRVTWGAETETDDSEGKIIQTSAHRPTEDDIRAILPIFIGTIQQMPPAYSALKINGRRAYDLARSGQEVSLQPRPVQIDELILIRAEDDFADFRVKCGKGTYVRSLGRDIGRHLGCLGHITALRRTVCGPFSVADAVPLDFFCEKRTPNEVQVLPLDTALVKLTGLTVNADVLRRLVQGQRIALKNVMEGLTGSVSEGEVIRLLSEGQLHGLVRMEKGVVHPYRMFCDVAVSDIKS